MNNLISTRLALVFIFFVLCGCVQDVNDPDVAVTYKKALLRTKQVQTISTNIDKHNELEIVFEINFPNQLVELHLETRPLATSDYTILNANGAVLESETIKGENSFYGSLDVFLNDVSIYTCLVEQCQMSQCSDAQENSLDGEFKTSRIHLNINRALLEPCTSADFNDGRNSLKVVHVDDELGPEFQGRFIRTQLSLFNLTYTPQGMKNATN